MFLDELIDSATNSLDYLDNLLDQTVDEIKETYILPEGEIDPRLKNLSYSSLLNLHLCPRKLQLKRLQSQEENNDVDGMQNITFAYGHVVGEGIQGIFEGKTEQQIIFQMFLGWHADLLLDDKKRNKSFWLAVIAVQKLIAMRSCGFLQDYELVYWGGKPAVELSFRITFPDGFKMRGFVDAVLRHKVTGKIIVLECKTDSALDINPAKYKNSAQAIGYSIVLDVLFPELSDYEVLYLIYKTKSLEYDMFAFTKTYLQRALWIQELLLDIETIKLYETAGVYPMHGENCLKYNRECEYLNLCTLSTEVLAKPYKVPEKEEEFMIELTLEDLINAQLSKS
jgi:hypothetical protein